MQQMRTTRAVAAPDKQQRSTLANGRILQVRDELGIVPRIEAGKGLIIR
jgi:hypothetical protein